VANSASVVAAYRDLRESLATLGDGTGDRTRAVTLRQRALVAGELAEQCDGAFADREVPRGDQALTEATSARQLADEADGNNDATVDAAIRSAGQANTTLNGILRETTIANSRSAPIMDRFRGSLRVSPSEPGSPAALRRESVSPVGGKSAHGGSPAYVASVALLFPTEAVALFPIGRSLASNSGIGLAIIIALIVTFIVVLRYFATQDEGGGSPAVKEILIAVFSFLLWVGSLKGFWIPGGTLNIGIDAELGSGLFGFATIMWVAIVPYFVRRPTEPII